MAFDVEKAGKELMSFDVWLWFAPLGFLTVWLAEFLAQYVSWGSWENALLGAIVAPVIAAIWVMIMKQPKLG